MNIISNEAVRAKQENIDGILKQELFDSPSPAWVEWVPEGLKKGLEEVRAGTTEEVDHGFLMKCLETVLIAKNSENMHNREQDGMYADRCGRVLSLIAKCDLGRVHSTRTMEEKYAVRAAASARTR